VNATKIYNRPPY